MTQAFHPHSGFTGLPGLPGHTPAHPARRGRRGPGGVATALRTWVSHHVVAMDPCPEPGTLDRLDHPGGGPRP